MSGVTAVPLQGTANNPTSATKPLVTPSSTLPLSATKPNGTPAAIASVKAPVAPKAAPKAALKPAGNPAPKSTTGIVVAKAQLPAAGIKTTAPPLTKGPPSSVPKSVVPGLTPVKKAPAETPPSTKSIPAPQVAAPVPANPPSFAEKTDKYLADGTKIVVGVTTLFGALDKLLGDDEKSVVAPATAKATPVKPADAKKIPAPKKAAVDIKGAPASKTAPKTSIKDIHTKAPLPQNDARVAPHGKLATPNHTSDVHDVQQYRDLGYTSYPQQHIVDVNEGVTYVQYTEAEEEYDGVDHADVGELEEGLVIVDESIAFEEGFNGYAVDGGEYQEVYVQDTGVFEHDSTVEVEETAYVADVEVDEPVEEIEEQLWNGEAGEDVGEYDDGGEQVDFDPSQAEYEEVAVANDDEEAGENGIEVTEVDVELSVNIEGGEDFEETQIQEDESAEYVQLDQEEDGDENEDGDALETAVEDDGDADADDGYGSDGGAVAPSNDGDDDSD